MSTPTATRPAQPPAKPAEKDEKGKRQYTDLKKTLKFPDLNTMTTEVVPQEEWESHPLSAGPERDPAQKKADAWVKEAHDAWVADGRPKVDAAPRFRIRSTPEHAPAYRYLLRQGASHHNVRLILDEAQHGQDGREVIVYAAVDRRKREPKKDDTTAQAPAQTPAQAQSPKPGQEQRKK